MLDCHPDVFGGPEFLHIQDIINLGKKLHGSISRGWIDLICSHEQADVHIRSLIIDILVPFADRNGGKYLSEKTPENVLVFPELVELLPNARFIHIVRDPRATVASLLNVGKRARSKGETPAPFTTNVRAAARYVKRCLDSGFKATRLAPEKVYTVVYEELVKNPDQETRNVCDFLGVEWAPTMLKPGEQNHLGEAAITVNSKEIWFDSQTYNSNPNTQSLEKWRSTLDPYQQFAVYRAFRNSGDLKRLGYNISLDGMNKASQMGGALYFGLTGLRSRIGQKVGRLIRAAN